MKVITILLIAHHIIPNTILLTIYIVEVMEHNILILCMKLLTNWIHLEVNGMVKIIIYSKKSLTPYVLSNYIKNLLLVEMVEQLTDINVQNNVCLRLDKSPDNTMPPPLPPRNISNHGSISLNNTLRYFKCNNNLRGNSCCHDNVEINNRKTKTRLYERLIDYCIIDAELLDFYYMVKKVRKQYQYDDSTTNIGHIIASEFSYHYPQDTNIKLLVYPSLNILSSNAESKNACKVVFNGYGKPVVFTCDSMYDKLE